MGKKLGLKILMGLLIMDVAGMLYITSRNQVHDHEKRPAIALKIPADSSINNYIDRMYADKESKATDQDILETVRRLLKHGESYKTPWFTNMIVNDGPLYEACKLLVDSGNYNTASGNASRLKDDFLKSNIADMLIDHGQPDNSMDVILQISDVEIKYDKFKKTIQHGNIGNSAFLLGKLDSDHQARGINEYLATGNYRNAMRFQNRLENKGLENVIMFYSDDDLRRDAAMKSISRKDYFMARNFARYIKTNARLVPVIAELVSRNSIDVSFSLLKRLNRPVSDEDFKTLNDAYCGKGHRYWVQLLNKS